MIVSKTTCNRHYCYHVEVVQYRPPNCRPVPTKNSYKEKSLLSFDSKMAENKRRKKENGLRST